MKKASKAGIHRKLRATTKKLQEARRKAIRDIDWMERYLATVVQAGQVQAELLKLLRFGE
jgi:hypothetical protein